MSAKLGKEYDLLNLALHDFYSKYDIRYFMNRLHDIKIVFYCSLYTVPFLISCFIEAFIVVDCDILFYSKSGITGLMGFAH